MHRRGTRLAAGLAAACLAAFGAAACGSSDNNDSGSSGNAKSSGGGGKEGGSVKGLIGPYPEHMDPAQGYTTQAAEIHWLTYLGLLSYKHAAGQEGSQLIPALVEALPTVSS